MSNHGKCDTPEYSCWRSMRARCNSPSHTEYKNYGAKGVTVCARWSNFMLFLQDMGLKPGPKHSLDRYPNNQGNYEPGNVRWASPLEQANNKRTSRWVSYRGQTMTVANAARAGGQNIDRGTVRMRLKNDWSIERAVETPLLFRRDPATGKVISK